MNKDVSIKICMGTGGIAAGGVEVMSTFEKALASAGVKAAVQKNCSMHKVGCRGFCARDVLVDVIIDGTKSTYQYIKPDMVERIVQEHVVGGAPVGEWLVTDDYHTFHDKQIKVVLSDCGEVDPEDIDSYIGRGGYEAVKKVLTTMQPQETIDVIKASGLRGRGGAGFPTAVKWDMAIKAPGPKKYLICNADEGDPGAFMDRSVVEGNPHAVIEGMIIGAYAIGAPYGYVYIRAEYPLAVERLHLAIKQAKERGYLGKNILGKGHDFMIKVKLGAGAFVCGEETALIASIEGKRGQPKAKPPFPVQKGLWGYPTIINNVETLANVPYIIRKGAAWYAAMGTEKSKGTKVFALTGKIQNSGLIEVPMGIPLKEVIYDIGGGIENGKKLKAVQTGGPSGGCIPANMMDTTLDYESLGKVGSIMGSGGMVVLDETDCMVNVAKYFLQFTQSESCGKCIPCRVGTKRLLEILTRITEGKGREGDIELLESLAADVKTSSLCGLGQSAPNPVLSTIRYYRDEYEAHIFEKRCPAGKCKDLLSYSILEEFCKGCTACTRVCPAGAIIGEKKKPHKIIQDICIKCGACFETCKFKAIKKG
jgi:NADH:ubiquinone oxidoreductase subunit F (NADH-binding)/NAD-dependent dihydropyrimidine dehydrogenase PreA subunit/(2Fe-2S) ferredoxin